MSGFSRVGEALIAVLVIASITFLACGDDANPGTDTEEDGGSSGRGGGRIPPRMRVDSGVNDSGADMDGSAVRDGSTREDGSTEPDPEMDAGDDMPMSGT